MGNYYQNTGATILAVLSTGCASSDLLHSSEPGQQRSGINIPYHLPEGLVTLRFARDDDDKLDVEFLDIRYQPDPEHLYVLEYDHSNLSDDTISVQLSPEGFLQTISAKSKDQTGEVVSKVFELATEIAKIAVGVRGGGGSLESFEYTTAFDPTDPNEIKRVKSDLATFRVEVEIKPEMLGSKPNGAQTCERGACFRPALPYKLTVDYNNKGRRLPEHKQRKYSKSALVQLPNEAPVMSIDLDRYAFVEAETTVTFTNGMLTKVDLKKPSEAVGFMNIPVDAAKAIVSIPSALLNFRVTSLTDEKSLLDSQKELIDSQMTLMQAQQEALEAQTKPSEN